MVPRGPIEEWFVDLAACFGAVVSEWSYAVEVAVIKWCLKNDPLVVGSQCPLATLEGFVDNWFLIGSFNDASFHSKWAHVKENVSPSSAWKCMKSSRVSPGPSMLLAEIGTPPPAFFLAPLISSSRLVLLFPSGRNVPCLAVLSQFWKLKSLLVFSAGSPPHAPSSFRLLPICKRLVSPFRKLEVLPPSMLVPLKLSTSSVRFSLRGMGSAQYRPVSRLFTVLNSLFARMLLRVMAAEASACPSPLARAVSMRAFMPGAPRRKHKLLDTG